MKELAKTVGQYVLLTAVTVFACAVMWYVSSRKTTVTIDGADVAPPAVAAMPKSLVAVERVEPQITELTLKQSGKIRAWESFTLGFEVAGRVSGLGENESGRPLDDGDRVTEGQVLARLDDRIYNARRSEAIAQLEQATSDTRRDRRLFEQGRSTITEAEFQDTLTRLAVAKAQQEIAIKNLEDTVLKSPVSGSISRRMVEPGESVTAHETVFEIVQNDKLLLIVDVPESKIRELEARQREVAAARQDPSVTDPEARAFRARVYLEGRDAFGDQWPPIEAEVYRIAQVADERTKLFEVEVLIDNREGFLRPGMVATTEIVIKRVMAYQVPESAVIFRGGEAFLFEVTAEKAPVKALFWDVGQTDLAVAQRVDLEAWVEQGRSVIVPAGEHQLRLVVTRGQQRLTGGQYVRVVNPERLSSPGSDATARRSDAGVPPGVN